MLGCTALGPCRCLRSVRRTPATVERSFRLTSRDLCDLRPGSFMRSDGPLEPRGFPCDRIPLKPGGHHIMAVRNHSALFVLVTIFIDAIGFGLIMPVLPQLADGGRPHRPEPTRSDRRVDRAGDGGGDVLRGARARQSVGRLWPPPGAALRARRARARLSAACGRPHAAAASSSGAYCPASSAAAMRPPGGRSPTSPRRRTAPRPSAIVSAAFGIGFVLGPAIGGLLGEMGPRAPFYAAAAHGRRSTCSTASSSFPKRSTPRTAVRSTGGAPIRSARSKTARAAPGMLGVAASPRHLADRQPRLSADLELLRHRAARLVAAHDRPQPRGGRRHHRAQPGLPHRPRRRSASGNAMRRRSASSSRSAGFVAYTFVHTTFQAFLAMLGFIAMQRFVQPSLMAMLSAAARRPRHRARCRASRRWRWASVRSSAPLVLVQPMAWFTAARRAGALPRRGFRRGGGLRGHRPRHAAAPPPAGCSRSIRFRRHRLAYPSPRAQRSARRCTCPARAWSVDRTTKLAPTRPSRKKG